MIQATKDAISAQVTDGTLGRRLLMAAIAAGAIVQSYGLPGWIESLPARPQDGFVGMPGFWMPFGDAASEWAALLVPTLTTFLTLGSKNGSAKKEE